MGLSRPLSFIHLGCTTNLTNTVSDKPANRPGKMAQWVIVFSVQASRPEFGHLATT